MKVGIVSIFDNENLGNKLQNYALQQILLNYAPQVVTIKNKASCRSGADFLKRSSFLAESVCANRLLGKRRKAELLEFHHKFIQDNGSNYWYSKKCDTLKPKDRYDLYCAGSDQVWNPNLGRYGMFSYLGFAERERTFSYAASFGVDTIPEEYKEDVRRGLQHIKYISVREDSGKRIVEELTGRTDVQVLVDPTMLLTTEQWDQVASKPKAKMPEKYILTYFLGDMPQERAKAIREKVKELRCEVIELMDPGSPFYAIGPGEFIYLIKHAELVCTDSFHASVFSFLYQRALAIFARDGTGSNMGDRLQTLVAKLHLESSLIQGNQIPNLPEKPDYCAGYAVLEEERKKSKAFLDMVFSEAKKVELCK